MRKKLPVLLMLALLTVTGSLFAQDTIRSLVITEWRGDWAHNSYLELTNMGDTELDLSEFTVGLFVGGNAYADQAPERMKRLEGILPAGETYLIAAIAEGSEDWIDPPGYPKIHPRILEKADLLVYLDEDNNRIQAAGLTPEEDSISPGFYELMNVNRGERAHFLFHHTAPDDSVVVDGVGLVFDPNDGSLIFDQFKDVAGVSNATETHILVRKFSVKEGNPDWKATRGATPEESQWMPIPFETGWWNRYSGEYTTAGNHGLYSTSESSVKPQPDVALDIDFTSKTITVPWGTLRDTIGLTPWVMFDFGDGLAWNYNLKPIREDSVHTLAQEGDVMTLYAVGNELETVDFTIQVAPPTNDMNEVFPIHTINADGYYTNFEYYNVTQNDPVIDSITDVPFALRVDTLLTRLEKAPEATWEIEWVDGQERPDLKFGDKLMVTAENGDVKEYFIAVEEYEPNHNASLGAITWPEIPEYLAGGNGWKGDTIPNFLPAGLVYEVTVPYGVEGIPALVAQPQNTNARVEMDRAISLSGSIEDRTTTFTVYAEDDTTYKEYKVMFKKEILQDWIQPFEPDPIISQVARHMYFANFWTEIFNPGNQDLDLSHYMLSFGFNGSTPSEVIEYDPTYSERYLKYVPGYKYSDDEAVYQVDKALKKDLSVDAVVKPQETWLFGQFADREARRMTDIEAITDFHLSPTVENVWGITYDGYAQISQHTYRKWPLYLYKIVNDSVLDGSKLPNDPDDFVLIDVFGRYPNDAKVQYDPAGINGDDWKQGFAASRKDTIWKGNTVSGGSFGTNPEDSEWTNIRWKGIYDPEITNLNQWNWCAEGLGFHNVQPITVYKSTITSLNYLVSEGYENGQTIDGIETGTTVDQMLANIIKADENQVLTVVSTADGSELSGDNALSLNDTLKVMSADSTNITAYILNVGDPLDDNALITSDLYSVNVTGSEGSIEGMEYGITISEILENIVVPSTATLNVVNQSDELVPLRILNGDTIYVDTKVHENIFFEVVAQNGKNKILYQLLPGAGSDDAFVLSDIYEVNQQLYFINFINNNTAVDKFLENIIPVKGATVKVLDKYGFERTKGFMAYDDVLEVTSESGNFTNTYYLGFKEELENQNSDAYVVSNVYTIDQIQQTISDVPANEEVGTFTGNLTPALGANFVVINADGLEQTEGIVQTGYQVVVTSEDESNIITYQVNVMVGVVNPDARTINLYPNPTTGKLFIDGLQEGDVISVVNLLGVVIKSIPFNEYQGHISLENLDEGLYFIKINSGINSSKIYKVYKN